MQNYVTSKYELSPQSVRKIPTKCSAFVVILLIFLSLFAVGCAGQYDFAGDTCVIVTLDKAYDGLTFNVPSVDIEEIEELTFKLTKSGTTPFDLVITSTYSSVYYYTITNAMLLNGEFNIEVSLANNGYRNIISVYGITSDVTIDDCTLYADGVKTDFEYDTSSGCILATTPEPMMSALLEIDGFTSLSGNASMYGYVSYTNLVVCDNSSSKAVIKLIYGDLDKDNYSIRAQALFTKEASYYKQSLTYDDPTTNYIFVEKGCDYLLTDIFTSDAGIYIKAEQLENNCIEVDVNDIIGNEVVSTDDIDIFTFEIYYYDHNNNIVPLDSELNQDASTLFSSYSSAEISTELDGNKLSVRAYSYGKQYVDCVTFITQDGILECTFIFAPDLMTYNEQEQCYEHEIIILEQDLQYEFCFDETYDNYIVTSMSMTFGTAYYSVQSPNKDGFYALISQSDYENGLAIYYTYYGRYGYYSSSFIVGHTALEEHLQTKEPITITLGVTLPF